MISANFPGFYETMISKRLLKDYYLFEGKNKYLQQSLMHKK